MSNYYPNSWNLGQQPPLPQTMQPIPNQPPEEKPHTVGFKTDEERVIFFQNVAELMFREGQIKKNTISAFMEHAAFETANFYLVKLMDKVKRPVPNSNNPRDPYNHIDDERATAIRPSSDIF